MTTKWILAFAFVGVFLFGAIAGGSVVAKWGRWAVEGRAVESATVQQWRRLGDDLNLTQEQRDQLRPIILKGIQERLESQRQIQRVNARVDKQILEVLTPAQAERFQEFRKHGRENERRWQRWFREQRKHTSEAPPQKDSP